MNVLIPKGTTVDLYAATGITVGVQINVQNIGDGEVRLYPDAVASDDNYTLITTYGYATNTAGDAGAYAYSLTGGLLNVRAV